MVGRVPTAGRSVLLIYMENDLTQVKVGDEPSECWEYGV